MRDLYLPSNNGALSQWKRCRVKDLPSTAIKPLRIGEEGKESFLEMLILGCPNLLAFPAPGEEGGIRGELVGFSQIRIEAFNGRPIVPDLVFFSETGDVVVVEVKLGTNQEIKDRQVIAQVLEYAACLSRMSEQELVDAFAGPGSDGLSWTDFVSRTFENRVLDPAALADRIRRRLSAGQVQLVIACDEAPPGLRELVRGVVGQAALGEYQFRVAEIAFFVPPSGDGLAVSPVSVLESEIVARTMVTVAFQSGGSDVTPTVQVQTTPASEIASAVEAVERGKRITYHWDVPKFAEFARQSFGTDRTGELLVGLVSRLDSDGVVIRFGTGKVPSINVIINQVSERYAAFTLFANGALAVNLGNMPEEMRAPLRELWQTTFGLKLQAKSYPYLPDAWLGSIDRLPQLINEIRDAVPRWRQDS